MWVTGLAALVLVGVATCFFLERFNGARPEPTHNLAVPVTRAEPTRRARQERLDRLTSRVRDVERRSRALGSRWEDVRRQYVGAQQSLTAAEVTYQVAARSTDAASATFSAARTVWHQARWRWQLYQQLVLVAAALDAHNLDRFRALTGSGVDSLDCNDGLSVQAFRKLMIARGINLTGKDIDHIVPRSLGGADHPANYQVLDRSLNRSLQDTWGPGKCRLVGKHKCAGAIAISRECGTYRGPEL